MIEFARGDVLQTDAEAVVNTVNCVGVMGRGVALQFKNAYPANYRAYKAACGRGEVRPGRMFVFDVAAVAGPRVIINFPTKRHWRGKSRLEDIDAGLEALVDVIRARDIRSIALPPLGSGLGGLDWSVVRARIVEALAKVDGLHATVFEPGAPSAVTYSNEVPKMSSGRAALVVMMNRYLDGQMDPAVSLLEVHKLLYFMQESGEPLRLDYVKAPYGPYAENLRHVLRAIEGHLVSGYGDGGDAPRKPLELVPGAVDDARAFLSSNPATDERCRRVGQLDEGFESGFGLELLSTVHWTVTRDGARDVAATIQGVYAWNERKRRFSERQIELAYEVLGANGYLDAAARSAGA